MTGLFWCVPLLKLMLRCATDVGARRAPAEVDGGVLGALE
jgi:hypothetical protein